LIHDFYNQFWRNIFKIEKRQKKKTIKEKAIKKQKQNCIGSIKILHPDLKSLSRIKPQRKPTKNICNYSLKEFDKYATKLG